MIVETSEFSEFSFGYALTDSLVYSLKSHLGKAPVFPSLIKEGKSGGGYDLELPLVPFPLFLQFKIQQVMRNKSSLQPPAYTTPYYRMPLRTKPPNQHQLLLDLEASKASAVVLYAAPLFHEVTDLDSHFMKKNVHKHTAFVSPSAIGSLDTKAHHLSYKPGASKYWVHSDPKEIDVEFTFDQVLARINRVREFARSASNIHSWPPSTEEIVRIQRTAVSSALEWFRERAVQTESGNVFSELFDIDIGDTRNMAMRLAYVAQVHFGLTLAWLDAADSGQSSNNG